MSNSVGDGDIQILDIDDPRWLALVKSHPDGNIFHHPAWINSLAESYQFRPFILANLHRNSEIGAGLPIMEVKSLLGKPRWVSLPFTDHCSPLYGSEKSLSALALFLVNSCNEKHLTKVECRATLPESLPFTKEYPFVLHTIKLCDDLDAMFLRIHKMHRRNLILAEKRGISIEISNDRADMEKFYKLHTMTRQRQGVPVQPHSFFMRLQKNLIESDLGFLLLGYYEKSCVAGAVFLHSANTLTYKYGASSLKGLSLRPNDLLFWAAIRWGCENGFKILDLGRSDLCNHGLRDYKSRWAGDEVRLTYSYYPQTQESISESKLMPLVNQAIRHSPIWFCRFLGEMSYRYFG